MSTSCNLVRVFGKEKKNDTKLIRVPIDDERHSGTALWVAFFKMAVGYPEKPDKDTQERAAIWLDYLDVMLPVQSYSCSYNKYKATFDLYEVASSQQKMVDYFVGLYNSVSENLTHKPTITSDEVNAAYGLRDVDASKKVYNSCAK